MEKIQFPFPFTFVIPLTVLCLAFFGCTSGKTTEHLFDRMIADSTEKGETQYISFHDGTDKSSGNRYYDAIIHSKDIDYDFLLDKAMSTKSTVLVFDYMPISIEEGDLALCMIWDTWGHSSDFEKLVPDDLREEYKTSGSWVLFDWMQEDKANREYVVSRTREILYGR